MTAHSPKKCGCGKCIPPNISHVEVYFIEKGKPESEAKAFFDEYSKRSWCNKQGTQIKNWKVHAWEWLWRNK